MKSMLRLVAARSLPDCRQSQSTTTTVRRSGQRVVPLPLLQLAYQRKASSSEDFVALRDARQSLRHMFFPQPSAGRRAAAVWNYRFDSGSQPPRSREHRGECGDSSDASFQLLPPVGPPACSPADDDDQLGDTETATTFDADRVDSEQFEYVFERFSVSSTESSCTSLSPESDTGTYSARAQRPSTTDTVATPQRLIETRASEAPPPLSPVSPRQRARGGESWPPQYTVIPSWPSVDDPYRFQYFGCGVHRDIMRRLHKSRSRRRNGKHGRGGSGADQQQQQQQQQPPPQKLEIVVPSHTECEMCNTYDCQHSDRRHRPKTSEQSTSASLTVKSAKSRDSLPMSVCTVLSRQTPHRLHNGCVPNGKEPAEVAAHGKGALMDRGKSDVIREKGEFSSRDQSDVAHRKGMPLERGMSDVAHGKGMPLERGMSDVGTHRKMAPLNKGQPGVTRGKGRVV